MYKVLLNQQILDVTKSFHCEFLAIPADPNKSARIPAGIADFIQALIARAEDDWNQEKAEFQRCYRVQTRLEDCACDPITRATAAGELLIKCNYALTYRSDDWADRHELKAQRKPFVQQASRLVKLIVSMSDALQVKKLVKEVKNAIPDMDLRGDDVELLFVRKLRMEYAEHLADLCVRIHEMYQSALPVELPTMLLRSQVYRNLSPLLIELARAEELRQKHMVKLYSGIPTPGILAAVSAMLQEQPEAQPEGGSNE